tara:strand:+ start:870 stop:1136 length:267 start_codon:yes stop_codon:yes gene_type:complete
MGNFSFSNREDFKKLIAENSQLFGAVVPVVFDLNGELTQTINHNKERFVMYRTYDLNFKEIEVIVNNTNTNQVKLTSNAPLLGYIVIF